MSWFRQMMVPKNFVFRAYFRTRCFSCRTVGRRSANEEPDAACRYAWGSDNASPYGVDGYYCCTGFCLSCAPGFQECSCGRRNGEPGGQDGNGRGSHRCYTGRRGGRLCRVCLGLKRAAAASEAAAGTSATNAARDAKSANDAKTAVESLAATWPETVSNGKQQIIEARNEAVTAIQDKQADSVLAVGRASQTAQQNIAGARTDAVAAVQTAQERAVGAITPLSSVPKPLKRL